MERGLNKITGTDKQTVEMLKDKVLSGGGGGSGGSLGHRLEENYIETTGAEISTDLTDLSSINFVFVKEILTLYDEYGVYTFKPGMFPVTSRTSNSITFDYVIDNGGADVVIDLTLSLDEGVSGENFTKQDGTSVFYLYSI